MLGHLSKSEFIGALDGGTLSRKRQAHLDRCESCRSTLADFAEIHSPLFDTDGDSVTPETARVDWNDLRSGVRDRLLARSVERSSRVRRWTGMAMKPAAAWSLGLAILITGATAGGYWHYQNDHRPSTTPDPVVAANTIDGNLLALEASEADLVAWSEPDVFSMLGELGSDEEEALRTLIAEAEVGELE